jgi:uncharacterized membrane protein YcaP (DUF421 family)
MLAHLGAVAGKTAAIYFTLFVMLRVAGRREIAQLTPMDLLTMLLLSETVSPALNDDASPIAGGLISAATLIVCTMLLSLVGFYGGKRADKLLEGHIETLIKDGHVLEDILHRHRISDAQLQTALHEHGVLTVGEVKRAFLEPNGQISIVKQE